MMTLLIAAAALTETAAGPAIGDAGEPEIIVVEGSRSSTSRWVMPDLDYDSDEGCPVLKESRIPGFGTVRFGMRCASKPSGDWIPFQN